MSASATAQKITRVISFSESVCQKLSASMSNSGLPHSSLTCFKIISIEGFAGAIYYIFSLRFDPSGFGVSRKQATVVKFCFACVSGQP